MKIEISIIREILKMTFFSSYLLCRGLSSFSSFNRWQAKLEGARGAMLRHEKATAEQARSLQYRLLAVEKGLEAAEKEKAGLAGRGY